MSIPLLGEPGRTTFNRSFFNVRLNELVEKAGASPKTRVTLFLSDGLQLGLCHIEEMSDEYLVVRGYRDEPGCALTVHVIPYALIYRMEIDPTGADDERVGFTARHPDD